MAATSAPTESGVERSRSGLRQWLAAIWGPNEGKLGVVILVLFCAVVALGPLLAPYGPSAIGVGPPTAGGGSSSYNVDVGNAQEVTNTSSGGLGESAWFIRW